MKAISNLRQSFEDRTKLIGGDGAELPPNNHWIYIWSLSQYLLYPIIAIVSWWNLSTGWHLSTDLHLSFGWQVFNGWNLLWSIPLAFAQYNLWMTGHDACHNSIFEPKYYRFNQLVAFITLDCTILTQKTWLIVHHKEHHPYPNSSVDGQRLEGQGMLAELWNVFLLLLEYLKMDLVDCVKEPKISKVLTLMMRYAILLSFGWALPVVLFFLVFFAAYFGLLSHSIIPLPNAVTFRQKQLSNTVDLMPGSWFGEFCTGGLNTHAVHHVWPHLPRGLHGWASKQLNDLEPEFYRSYDTIGTIKFWWNRKNPRQKDKLPIPSEYYKNK
jgi:fatty acid desaturase